MKKVMYHFIDISNEGLDYLKKLREIRNVVLTYRTTSNNENSEIVASIYGPKSKIDHLRTRDIEARKMIRSGVNKKRGDINAMFWLSIQKGYCSMSDSAKQRAVDNFRNLLPK